MPLGALDRHARMQLHLLLFSITKHASHVLSDTHSPIKRKGTRMPTSHMFRPLYLSLNCRGISCIPYSFMSTFIAMFDTPADSTGAPSPKIPFGTKKGSLVNTSCAPNPHFSSHRRRIVHHPSETLFHTTTYLFPLFNKEKPTTTAIE